MRGVKISLRYIDPGVKISYDLLTPGSIYRGVKISSHTGVNVNLSPSTTSILESRCNFHENKVHWNYSWISITVMLHDHSGWTPFHPMYENSTLCTKWFVHQANTAGTFIVHQANAAGAFIVHQGNVVEHSGSYIKQNGGSSTVMIVVPYQITGNSTVRSTSNIKEDIKYLQYKIIWTIPCDKQEYGSGH